MFPVCSLNSERPLRKSWFLSWFLSQLLSGKYPFTDEEGLAKDSEQVFSSILSKDPDFTGEPWDAISPGAVELIRALLNKDPSSRPSARVALGYDWVRAIYITQDNIQIKNRIR
jgi:calcium-dependent protein kinase